MIRVLIAEDEPPIARAISRMVEETSPTCKVAACVSNGYDALEYLRRDPVDLVFTDIRMPVMDGLKLLQSLRSENIDCHVVIISGHQDFEYTQKALRLGAFDYILKPISRDKLKELLDRLEEACARRLLQEAADTWRAGGMAPAAGAGLSGELPYSLMLALAGHWPTISDDSLSPGAVFWQANDPYLLIKELTGSTSTVTFVGRAAAERIFLLENASLGETSALAALLFERLTQLSALPKTLFVMPGPLRYSEIASAIITARKRIYSQIGLCRSAMIVEQNPAISPAGSPATSPATGPANSPATSPANSAAISAATSPAGSAPPEAAGTTPRTLPAEMLAEALCVRKEKQIGEAVEASVDAAVQSEMTQTGFEHFLETVIHDKRLSLDTKQLKEDIGEAILGATTPAGLKADLKQILSHYVLGESKSELMSRVDLVRQYLAEHYPEDISSETLSARFGFVPSYLSKVFRRQTGISPTEYLTGLRMAKAKELLASKPGLLIRDAAMLVGYKDPYYFSKLFKKATGLWPSEYQDAARGD